MKSIKLHLIVLVIIVIAELIGNIVINVGIGKIVLLPMMYALIMGVLTAPKFTKISGEKEIHAASGLLGVTLVLLMARYGTLVGPTLPKILAASPALILQEFGNLGTVLIGIPLAVLIGLKREAIGAAHSVAREPNVALIGERYGLDAAEGASWASTSVGLSSVPFSLALWPAWQLLTCLSTLWRSPWRQAWGQQA